MIEITDINDSHWPLNEVMDHYTNQAKAQGLELSARHHANMLALLRENDAAIASALGVYDVEIGKAGRVCAYCGTKHQADRCESCGAPAR